MRWKALPAVLVWLVAACSGAAVEPEAPIEVGGGEEPSPTESTEPVAHQQPNPFPKFADEFMATLNAKGDLDRYVAPELGVFLLTNPGAFHAISRFDSLAELRSASESYVLSAMSDECKGANWLTSDDHVPQYSCDTEQYDISAPCVRGAVHSDALSKLIAANVQYDLIPADEGERRMPAAKRSEELTTHYLFMQRLHLGFYFGLVDGQWRLLWIDAIEPCSA